MSELVAESVARLRIREIAALFAPAHNGVGHPAYELAHGIFPFAGAWLAVEIFAGHDVRRGLRPVLGDFHTFLAEDGRAFFVADQRRALLPLHHVERGSLAVRETTPKHQSLATTGVVRVRS